MGYTRFAVGNKFGRLTITSLDRKTARCLCECGIYKIVGKRHLRAGNTKSCGCLAQEILVKRNTKHSLTYTKFYRVWCRIKSRCECSTYHQYKDYGGRGIYVCDTWQDPVVFIKWCEEKNPGEGLTLDREDNHGPYSPTNCRWVTRTIQNRNKRNVPKYLYQGELLCVIEIIEKYHPNLNKFTVHTRLSRGLSIEEAIRLSI